MTISAKEATILSIILEGILYGFSVLLFGITLWSLTYRRRNYADVAHPILAAACLLFLLGTMHIIIDAYHAWRGFISLGGEDSFFVDVSKDTFRNILYEVETLVADAILIYKCYVVWQRFEVIIIPLVGWMGVAVTATHTVWSVSQLSMAMNPDIIFIQVSQKWVVSFYSMALATNSIATGILAFKLWSVHRDSSMFRVTTSKIFPVFLIIMECGALYSLSLVVMMVTYLSTSNSSCIMIDLISQIIPITFCLIIFRTAMLRFGDDIVQYTNASDRLPMTRAMGIQIDQLGMVGSKIDRTPGTSFHSDLKVHHIQELEENPNSQVCYSPGPH